MPLPLHRLAEGQTLNGEEAEAALHTLMRGEAKPEAVAAFLMGLRARGETVDELTAFTRVMRQYAVPVHAPDPDTIDIVGTGGDGSGTFNISTATAFVCAGAGVPVAKHGNRSVSSRCGSADVLEALGVRADLGAAGVEACLAEAGIAFLFAPVFHPAVRHVMPVRRALGVRTFFNILGPLCNPAGVRRYLIGAFSVDVARTMIGILARLGAAHAVTVHSEDGMDELSISAPTTVFEYEAGASPLVHEGRTVTPESLGLSRALAGSLRGGDARTNAAYMEALLRGEPGARRDVVLLNAAYALRVSGRFGDLKACLAAARESLDSGAALATLHRLAALSQRLPDPA